MKPKKDVPSKEIPGCPDTKYEGVRSDDKFKGENSVCESCYREQIWIHAKKKFLENLW